MDRRSGRADRSVVVRPARDLAEGVRAGELLKASFDARNRAIPAYREHLRDIAPRMTLSTLLVAVDGEDEDRLLGTTTFCLAGTTYAFASREGECELRMMAIGPAEPEGGLVEQLLVEKCLELGMESGATALVLTGAQTDPAPAKYYRRRGFRRESSRTLTPAPGILLTVWRVPLPVGPFEVKADSGLSRFLSRKG